MQPLPSKGLVTGAQELTTLAMPHLKQSPYSADCAWEHSLLIVHGNIVQPGVLHVPLELYACARATTYPQLKGPGDRANSPII